MHDCCIRVTVLLEYFEQTLSKQTQQVGMLIHASGLG